jgi:phage N-6-adenine-methyltransferase
MAYVEWKNTHVAPKKTRAHVANNSGNNEWYTPPEYIAAARACMGGIDLDPASSDIANRTVRASRYYTKEVNGLTKSWSGRVWMNPPYSRDCIKSFCEKLVASLDDIETACVLVNNATETAWFQMMAKATAAICFPSGRVKFINEFGVRSKSPLQGQAILYFGSDAARFVESFSRFGWIGVAS